MAQVDFRADHRIPFSKLMLRDVFLKTLWTPEVLSVIERDRDENDAARVALPGLSLTDGWLWLIVALSLLVTKFRQCHPIHEKAFEIARSLLPSHCISLSLSHSLSLSNSLFVTFKGSYEFTLRTCRYMYKIGTF